MTNNGPATGQDNTIWIIIGVVAGVLCCVLILCVLLLQRRRQKSKAAMRAATADAYTPMVAPANQKSIVQTYGVTPANPNGDYLMMQMNTNNTLAAAPQPFMQQDAMMYAPQDAPMPVPLPPQATMPPEPMMPPRPSMLPQPSMPMLPPPPPMASQPVVTLPPQTGIYVAHDLEHRSSMASVTTYQHLDTAGRSQTGSSHYGFRPASLNNDGGSGGLVDAGGTYGSLQLAENSEFVGQYQALDGAAAVRPLPPPPPN